MERVWRGGRLLLIAGVLTIAGETFAAATDKADVRVLIDISGSMRQNDPDNLRRPALRMLSGLLQPGTRAGVWTFARWVNNLVPVAEVDAAWKRRTQSLSEQIGSPGRFTNIEEVLDSASRDWEGEAATHARHLVLLTDGMVDVSKVAAENAQSRARILTELLPRLKAGGVKLHTIALSERADHELMQRLAADTGGWYQQVARADELQRVFLRMFEQVGVPDSVPLQDNRFTVDGAVSEATVLVFSKPDAPPAKLHSPSGQSYADSDLPAGVAWYRDRGYDLVTLASPEKGEWRIEADVDPDNRVMIVTDLKLQTSEIPTHLAAGESMRVEANLSNRGKQVTRKAFLRLLEVRADKHTSSGTEPQALADDGTAPDEKAGDGRYTMRLGEPKPQEKLELVIAVDSPTFMREKRFHLVVHEPAQAVITEDADGGLLQVRAQEAVMQVPGLAVEAWQEGADGKPQPLRLEAAGEGAWQARLSDVSAASYIKVSGTTRIGNLIERTLGPVMAPGIEPPAQVAVAPVDPPAATPVAVEAPAPEAAAAAPDAATSSEPADQQGWVMPAIVFGGFNLLLLVGVGVWLFLRRRRAAADDDLQLDELVGEAGESAAGEEPVQENAA